MFALLNTSFIDLLLASDLVENKPFTKTNKVHKD